MANINTDNNNENKNTTITNININTAPVEGKPPQSPQPNESKTKIIIAGITIVVAVIGLIGTLTETLLDPGLIQVLGAKRATETQPVTISTSTSTLPAPSATFTFVPSPFASATFSPSPVVLVSKTCTATALPPTATTHPTSIPGDDWDRDCIDLTTWTPYLTDGEMPNPKYCVQLAPWGITTQDGYLIFNTLKTISTAKEYGIITSLPLRADIELTIDVRDLVNSEVWIGILDGDQPDKLSGFMFVIQPNRSMDFRGISPTYDIVANSHFSGVIDKFPVKIVLDAGQMSVFVDNAGLVYNRPVSFSNRKLFVGYRLLPNNEINVSVYNLQITEK